MSNSHHMNQNHIIEPYIYLYLYSNKVSSTWVRIWTTAFLSRASLLDPIRLLRLPVVVLSRFRDF